jgi:hypothetical protein
MADAGETTAEPDLTTRLKGPDLEPLRTAVVHPVKAGSLKGALDAAAAGLIAPVLVGPRAKIGAAAAEIGADLTGLTLIDVPHSQSTSPTATPPPPRRSALSGPERSARS